MKNRKYFIYVYIPAAMLVGFLLNHVLPLRIHSHLNRIVLQTATDWIILLILGNAFYRLLNQEVIERQKSLEHYEVLNEKSLAGIYLIQDSKFRYVNPALAKIFGYAIEELNDRMDLFDLVYPDDRPAQITCWRQLIAGEISEAHFVLRGLKKDGKIINIVIFHRRIEYNGRVAIGGTLLDITEQQSLQAKLQFQAILLNHVFDSIIAIDVLGNIIYANRTAYADRGYNENDLLGTNVNKLIAPECEDEFLQRLKKMPSLSIGENLLFETSHLHKVGHRIPLEVRASLVEVGGQKIFLGVGRQIAERKLAEEKLKNLNKELERQVQERTTDLQIARDRLTHIIDAVPMVIFSSHPFPPYQVTFVSDHIRNFGFVPTDLLSEPGFWSAHVHPEDRCFLDYFAENLLKDGRLSHQYRFRIASGEYIWIRTEAKLIRDRDDNPVEIIGYWADITRQTQLEQKLEILSGGRRRIGVWGKSGGILSVMTPTLSPSSWNRLKECLQVAFRGEIIGGVSVRLEVPNGNFLHGFLSAGPLKNEEEKSIATVGIILSITQHKRHLH